MRVAKAIVIVMAFVLSALVLVRCSDNGTDSDGEKNFEIREWGVLVGCVEDSSFFLTSRPEVSSLVKLPVIYVHSRNKTPFTVRATFRTGGPTDTYPPASIGQKKVEWQNVEFPIGATQEKINSGKDFVPLENIIPTLNNVDADIIEYNGWLSRFLFYEGRVEFRSRVTATYDLTNAVAHVTNHEDYTLHNVNLIIRRQNTYGPLPVSVYAHWNKVDPGQTVDGSLFEEPVYSYYTDMQTQGFSEMEAQSFAGLWEPTFNMGSSTTGAANLVYRLPQSEYDSLISLSVTPAPDKLVRTLYVLIHLQDSLQDTLVARKLIGSWEWVQSFGGIAGRSITPETEGYTKTAHFLDDLSYREERNDTLFLESTYRVYQEGVKDTTVNMLQIGAGEPLEIFNVTDSTLELMDRCIDCYQHSYRRLVTR